MHGDVHLSCRGSPLPRIVVHSIKNQAKIYMGLIGESTQNRRKNLRTPSRRVANPSERLVGEMGMSIPVAAAFVMIVVGNQRSSNIGWKGCQGSKPSTVEQWTFNEYVIKWTFSHNVRWFPMYDQTLNSNKQRLSISYFVILSLIITETSSSKIV